MTIRKGLYSFNAMPGMVEARKSVGVLIFHDGTINGGDSFAFYTGTYECTADRNWQGKITSQDHTPTTRPLSDRVQQIDFIGIHSDSGAKIDAMALVRITSFGTMRRAPALCELTRRSVERFPTRRSLAKHGHVGTYRIVSFWPRNATDRFKILFFFPTLKR
jgi:hypothetical protein